MDERKNIVLPSFKPSRVEVLRESCTEKGLKEGGTGVQSLVISLLTILIQKRWQGEDRDNIFPPLISQGWVNFPVGLVGTRLTCWFLFQSCFTQSERTL